MIWTIFKLLGELFFASFFLGPLVFSAIYLIVKADRPEISKKVKRLSQVLGWTSVLIMFRVFCYTLFAITREFLSLVNIDISIDMPYFLEVLGTTISLLLSAISISVAFCVRHKEIHKKGKTLNILALILLLSEIPICIIVSIGSYVMLATGIASGISSTNIHYTLLCFDLPLKMIIAAISLIISTSLMASILITDKKQKP